jgi:hypothetical protein
MNELLEQLLEQDFEDIFEPVSDEEAEDRVSEIRKKVLAWVRTANREDLEYLWDADHNYDDYVEDPMSSYYGVTPPLPKFPIEQERAEKFRQQVIAKIESTEYEINYVIYLYDAIYKDICDRKFHIY